MSFSINISGHISPEDPRKDAIVRAAAKAICAIFDAAQIPYGGSVGTPSGGEGLQSAPTIHVGGPTPDSATPSGGHKKP